VGGGGAESSTVVGSAGILSPRSSEKMLEHGALVLSEIGDLVRVLPTDDIREAVAF
jgi:hypothetical protein